MSLFESYLLQYKALPHGSNILKCITMENHNGVVKTRQQMADEYGICRKTFNKLLQRKQITIERGLIYPKEQESIYKELGLPQSIQRGQQLPKSSQ